MGVVNNAVAGLGLSPEIAMVTFPMDLFLVESELSAIRANIDGFVAGLTEWRPKVD